ncbi:MAG: recombination protein RecR [Candidatus Omnitrophica bacterium]|nr:recombination protein RecR [Candidatus Omnitrophota bacterium]
MAKLIKEFSKMPGVGVRSAERLTFHILKSSAEDVKALSRYIGEVKERVQFCEKCNNLSECEICSICSDNKRDPGKLCVVSSPNGVIAMEKANAYNGLYYVLLGELSPLDGVGPRELKIEGLLKRVKDENINEIILSTNFTTEGETTALYIMKLLEPFKIRVTRLARGVPVGASLEYADGATLQRAYEERR